MIDRMILATERSVSASPIWLRLVDTFTGRAPVGPIEIVLEKSILAEWVTVHTPFRLSPGGDLAFANLGRVPVGEDGQQFNFRVSVTAANTITEAASGGRSVVVPVTTWTPDAPPPTPARQEIRCYPGPDYRFGPGIPLLSGRVADQAGDPVARARVTASETVLGNVVIEEVRTNDDGLFRLPMRWSSGSTQVYADRLGAVGTVTIDVPADLRSNPLITLS